MRRSQVNRIIGEGIEFIEAANVSLPPFAFWSPQDWAARGPECDEIRTNMLGWDVTDFGGGDFDSLGLLLFTLRNGDCESPERKPYCEKILILRPNQRCPMHFHWRKVEDIINRAGGSLTLKLHGADPEGNVDDRRPVTVSLDGVAGELAAGGRVTLKPGESICLPPLLYHEFWAEGGPVLIGEVSAVNDDTTDNRFAQQLGRFPKIEEDEPVLHYLCNEYPPAD